MTQKLTQTMSGLVRKLTNAQLIERLAAFAGSDDDGMRTILINEAKRRGL